MAATDASSDMLRMALAAKGMAVDGTRTEQLARLLHKKSQGGAEPSADDA